MSMAGARESGPFSIEKLAQATIPKAWLKPAKGFSSIAGQPIIGGWSVTIEKAGFYRIWIDGLYGVSATEFIVLHNGEECGCVMRAPVRVGEGGDFVLVTERSCRPGDKIKLDDGADDDDVTRHQSMPRMVAVPLLYGDIQA